MEFDGEGELAGPAPDGEVAGHVVAVFGGHDAGRLEGHLRMVVDVEEVVAAQVGVSVGVAGVDRCQVDLGPKGTGAEVVADGDGGIETVEPAAHLGDAEVAGGELNRAVSVIEDPGSRVQGQCHENETSGLAFDSNTSGLEIDSIARWPPVALGTPPRSVAS